jgi:hypothetical protein
MNPFKAISTGIIALLICGVAITSALAAPKTIAAQGPYIHAPSKVKFPEKVGEFQRGEIHQFDDKGTDVSGGFNHTTLPIAFTLYVYPSPSITSFGSPANVVATARAKLTDREFEARKKEIMSVHPGAKLIEQRDISHSDGGQTFPGKTAVFEFDDIFAGAKTTVRSQLIIFCYVSEKWTVKYRVTHPKSVDADKAIQEFIEGWKWK